REIAHTTGNGETLRYSYGPGGRRTDLLLPDSTTESYTYSADQLLETATTASGLTRYEYDAVTRRLSRVTEADGRYVRYAYDAAGNRTLMAHGMPGGGSELSTTYSYDALNRLATIADPTGGVASYSYDAASKVTGVVQPNGTTMSADYDIRDRLTSLV